MSKNTQKHCLEVVVPTIKYQTADGKQFDSSRKAELHRMFLAGILRKCVPCAGTGEHCKYCYEGYTDVNGNPYWLKTDLALNAQEEGA